MLPSPGWRTAGTPRSRRVVAAVLEIDGERDADDRLDAGVGQLVGEFQRAEQVVGVGQPHGRESSLAASLASLPMGSAPSSSE